MLVIRDAQMAALGRSLEARFHQRLVDHAARHLPEPCAALGPDGLREACTFTIERGRAHGIEDERDVCKLLHLVLVLGRDFEALPWAAGILANRAIGPTLRVNRLHMAAQDREAGGTA